MKRMFVNFNSQTKTAQDAINDFIGTKKGKKADETVKYYKERLNEFNVHVY